MKDKDIKTVKQHTYLDDADYYKYIFKKTEKIVCALFYILRSSNIKDKNDAIINDLECEASGLLDKALRSLQSLSLNQIESACNLKYALISFETKIRLACAAQILSTEYLDVFLHEINSVQRVLRKYTEPKTKNPLFEQEEVLYTKPMLSLKKKDQTGMIPVGVVPQNVIGKSRKERILDILKDKNEATIKDISEMVKDCSEKTIQRELMSLISDSLIVREGERRWSKYKLV